MRVAGRKIGIFTATWAMGQRIQVKISSISSPSGAPACSVAALGQGVELRRTREAMRMSWTSWNCCYCPAVPGSCDPWKMKKYEERGSQLVFFLKNHTPSSQWPHTHIYMYINTYQYLLILVIYNKLLLPLKVGVDSQYSQLENGTPSLIILGWFPSKPATAWHPGCKVYKKWDLQTISNHGQPHGFTLTNLTTPEKICRFLLLWLVKNPTKTNINFYSILDQAFWWSNWCSFLGEVITTS